MAIQASIATIQGVSLTTAYINIGNPQISKKKTTIPATDTTPASTSNSYTFGGNAEIYESKASYDAGLIPLEGFPVTCLLDLTKDVFTQAYAELKLSTRLSNVEDC